MKATREEAIEQAKRLMALKPKKRFKLPGQFHTYTDAVATEGCKVTISEVRRDLAKGRGE